MSDGTTKMEDVTEQTNAKEEGEEEVEYVCPPEFDEREDMRKMFVLGLDNEATDEEFKTMFEKYGEVKEAVIFRNCESKNGCLFGFITFAKCDNLDDCLLARPHKYKEKTLEVKRAVPKGQRDGTAFLKVQQLRIVNVPETFDTKILLKYLKSRHPKKYGTIYKVDLLKTTDESGSLTEMNRGFGFITVSSDDFADRLAIGESYFTIYGIAMRLSKAKPKYSEGGGQRGGFHEKGQRSGGSAGWDNSWSYGGYGDGYGYGYGGYGGYGYYGGYPSYQQGYGGSARGGGYAEGMSEGTIKMEYVTEQTNVKKEVKKERKVRREVDKRYGPYYECDECDGFHSLAH